MPDASGAELFCGISGKWAKTSNFLVRKVIGLDPVLIRSNLSFLAICLSCCLIV